MYPFYSWSSTNAYTSSFSSLDNEYTFSFLGTNPFFSSMAWFHGFLVGMHSNSAFPNIFFHLQNFLGTNSFIFFSSSVFLTSCFFLVFHALLSPHIGGHLVIYTSPFSQSISGLWATSHGMPKIISVFSNLQTSICTLFICSWKYMLYSTSCVIDSLLFPVPFTFLTLINLFSFLS